MKSTLCFFDDYFITARPQTVRRTFRPEKLGVLNDTQTGLQTYTTMFYDKRVNKLRLYVEIPHDQSDTEIRDLVLYEGDRIEDFIGNGERLKRTVVKGFDTFVHGSSVYYDANAADESRRYVFAGNVNAIDHKNQRLAVAFSGDGITFSGITEIYPIPSDTYNSLYYNHAMQRYEISMRSAWGDRRISIIHSENLKDWSRPQMILHPCAEGGQGMGYYAFGVSNVGGMYYGLNWRFMTDVIAGDLTNMVGYMENQLYYSYDASAWIAASPSPIADRPLPPEYGSKQLWLSNVCEDAYGNFIICGGAARIAHGSRSDYEGQGKFVVTAFYRIRKNGFACLEGFGKQSKVLTKEFVFNGGDITLNCNATAGEVSVAVLQPNGNVVEGFSHDDCIPMNGVDLIDGKVEWKNANLDSLTGQRVRFEIVLNNAYLFSLSYDGSPSPNGWSVQNSYYNPLPKQL